MAVLTIYNVEQNASDNEVYKRGLNLFYFLEFHIEEGGYFVAYKISH